MLGAIIGDVVGSYYEVLEINAKKNKEKRSYEDRIKIMDTNIPLFTSNSSVTDDSILTIAIMDAILNNSSYEEKLREYGLKEINMGVDTYGRSRFGSGFVSWLKGNSEGNSYGNGCAMRISAVGYLFDSLEEVKRQSYLATIPTHNNPDSIKCAESIAVSIYLLRHGISKDKLKEYIINNYFNLDYDINELRNNYTFTSKAIDSVPQAIFCFLESSSFEDAIRISLSIGGDSDTISCITGSLAEAYYGIDDYLTNQVKPYLRDYMIPLLDKAYKNDKKHPFTLTPNK